MTEIIKIALSGGPCSGKTSCIDGVISYYKEQGIPVFVCPESATDIIESGVPRDDMLEFESAVALHQLELEEELDDIVSNEDIEKCIVIYDRGITDCFGYVEDEKALSDRIGIDRVSSWSRYEAVLILGSATSYVQSSVRTEDEDSARYYADSVLNAWMGHPHLRYIKAYDDFDDKLKHICGEIDCLVNDREMEKKYLVEYPDIASLSKYNPVKADIEQVYLLSNIGSHRIRKRSVDGVTSYFETLKIRIDGFTANEAENIISSSEYDTLLQNADPHKLPIVKERYCFLYEGQYFELDVFPFWDDKAFVELEIRDKNQKIILPPELKVIKDVSKNSHYKNNYLASKLYKDNNNENS